MGEYTRLEIRMITAREAANKTRNRIRLVSRRTVILFRMADFGIISMKVQSWIPLTEESA
ncbi:hypothetical protein D3C86_2216020 [compost metagenome]